MDIQYISNKLEKQLTNQREMRKAYPSHEKLIRRRIKAIQVADSVSDLELNDPGGRWHELNRDRKGCWGGRLSGNVRLVIEPDPPGTRSATTVTIIEVIDYH